MVEKTILDNWNDIILQEGIPDLNNKKLFKIVRRENSPFCSTLLRVGSTIKNSEFDFDNRMHTNLVLDRDIYADEGEFEHLKKVMVDCMKNDENFLDKYLKQVEDDSKRLIEWSKKADKKDLVKTFDQFIEKSLKMMTHLWPPLGPEEWVLKEIERKLADYINPKKDFAKFQKILNLLTAPSKYSSLNLKRLALLKTAIKSDFKDINKIVDKFAWINDIGLKFNYQTKEDFLKEIKNIKNPKQELEKFEKDKKLVEENKKNAIKEFKFDKKLLKLCYYAQMLPYIRFIRLECLIESAYHLRDLFEEIRKKIGVNNVTSFYYWEIRDMLKNKTKFKDKTEGYSFILIGNNFYDYDLETAKKIKEKIESQLKLEGEIKGQTACMGKAKGEVRVLHSAKEISRVKKGDILVTSMTTPNYVPAMERAAAFVTDEGGLSCHAAIVAREMNKPCIIGTKISTKVLKDGDLVEVDADKGVVRKC